VAERAPDRAARCCEAFVKRSAVFALQVLTTTE
jgi:hypothetical protein